MTCWHRPAGLLAALILAALVNSLAAQAPQAPQPQQPGKLKVLLLGDTGHHRPAVFAKILTAALAKQGIDIDYTADVADLTRARLAKYDALAIFRDSGNLPATNEAALLEFIEGGKGLVAIHCASHCFRNSDRYTALVGGRFKSHKTGVFRTRILDAQHPAMLGVKTFESWDETYLHDQVAKDIRVLMVREELGGYEPYTWVRDQGKGRVFYTALGHDERTWKVPGFQALLARGLRWAAGHAMQKKDLKPFEYVEAKIPIYRPKKGAKSEKLLMQLPLEPAESMKHFHLPEGFEIQLYAAEPDIARPIAMAWDEKGRLWIAESVDYPNERKPAGAGRDRIKICEDTKGTGRADKFTVFADKLSIPTSLVFAEGGVIVTQAPHTLFLKSTKGDDKADERKILFSGWGTYDTHAGPSNLRRGLDNWIWGTVGYSGFNGTIGGRRYNFKQGVYRFKPDGSAFEFLTSTTNNTWGLGLAETGEVFASTANGMHSVHLGLPNRVFEGVGGWFGKGSGPIADHRRIHPVTDKVRQVDFHGGFTAAAGHAVYTARSFPRDFWDRAAFVCEPTGHLVHVNRLVPQGSGWVARDGYSILASDDEWTAPIMAEIGPDGALWVIDWYNYIVQHNPTPPGFKTGKGNAYDTPLRDKTHGRIYRIVYTGAGAKKSTQPKLDAADPRGLIDALAHENLFWRQTAQRLLVERGKDDVLPALAKLVRDERKDAGATHALWAMHGLRAFQDAKKSPWVAVAHAALKHPEPAARRAALGVLPRHPDSVVAIANANILQDSQAGVRREALIALSEMPESKAAAPALAALLLESRNANDRWIPQAATAAAARSPLAFLQAAAATKKSATGDAALVEAVRVVAGHLARQAPADAAPLLAALAAAPPAVADAMLTGLANGWPAGKTVKLETDAAAALGKLPATLSSNGLVRLTALVKRWGQQDKLTNLSAGLKGGLLAKVADEKLADDDRAAAACDLIGMADDAASAAKILEQINAQASPALTRGLLEALGQSRAEEVAAAVVKRWGQLTPATRPAALTLLLRRPAWTKTLLGALEKGTIDRSDLSIDQVQFLSQHPDRTLAALAGKVLASSGRLPSADRKKVLDELLPLVKKSGDKVRGRAVFEANCAKCHRFGDLGNTVGPDLTGIAVRARPDILVDILDPNRSVEGNYRQYTVTTTNGVILNGLLAAETNTAIELLDGEGKKHVLLREDIDRLTSSKLSLMPEGFEKLPADDLVSLLDFLSARSKYLPLPLSKAATITSVKGMFISPDGDEQRLIFKKWGPQTAFGVPFQVIDPRGGSIPNAILLYGPNGAVSKKMPKSASVDCNAPAKAIHLLSGVSGWGYPYSKKGTLSMIVRLHYADGKTEDHELLNGVHFADYIREVDVPESKLAFRLRGQQLRYLTVTPKRDAVIARIEFVKGTDNTAPLVMAVTVEGREQ